MASAAVALQPELLADRKQLLRAPVNDGILQFTGT
jgi:hypothetical protein